jgi:hypothetical protein
MSGWISRPLPALKTLTPSLGARFDARLLTDPSINRDPWMPDRNAARFRDRLLLG